MPCQSGRTISAGLTFAVLAGSGTAAVAGSASWAHQAGTLNSNGSVTVKSLAGGSYAATQNPTGAVAKANQNAATQPPTVIIQATGNGLPFNYKDDCYVFELPSRSGTQMIGAGKVDASNKFTGILGLFNGNPGYSSGGALILSALTGVGYSGNSNYATAAPKWCAASETCAWEYAAQGNGGGWSVGYYQIVSVASMSTASLQKCYP